MTSPSPAAGFLDFFVLEASDYVEQMDALLLAGGAGAPDAGPLLRASRALRGSATMAKLAPFADLAAALERVARSLKEGSLAWSPALRGVLVATIDDCKILVHAARAWGDADTQRAAARAAELLGHAPAAPTAHATPSGGSNLEFLARETGNIAAGIELLLTARPDRATAGNVLQRVRALRGIAGLRDVPGLPPVLEGAEEGLAPMERGEGTVTAPQRELLQGVVSILRDAGNSMRGGQLPAIEGAPLVALERALDLFQESSVAAETILPVSALFPSDGDGIVSASPNPPTTPAARFRLELVGHGEHLRRIVSEARGNADPTARDRFRRVTRQALRATRALAESFGRAPVANAIAEVADRVTTYDERALGLLEQVAEVLSRPEADGQAVEASLARTLSTAPVAPHTPPVSQAQFTPSSAPTPIMPMAAIPSAPVYTPRVTAPAHPTPVAVAPPAVAPTPSRGLEALLAQGAASVDALADNPFAAPVPMPEQPIVPVETLLYRGRAALRRAIELRDLMRNSGAAPERESLEELFDLLDLALVAD